MEVGVSFSGSMFFFKAPNVLVNTKPENEHIFQRPKLSSVTSSTRVMVSHQHTQVSTFRAIKHSVTHFFWPALKTK